MSSFQQNSINKCEVLEHRARKSEANPNRQKIKCFYFSQLFWIMSRSQKEMKIIFLLSDDFVEWFLLIFLVEFSIVFT